ncbi:Protein CBG06477 [Caenorhabditis briggsae]|uniref:Protein CBG06477 n=1 Tax=Caenorhabditis briggsae TaxID=6238 RepID=A8X2B3_CAEBR|nr:Protein CBG06477 [Caenorhabditis briggsae]CAP26773.1 Protein CBG06477 [Caenorhabditis briggsae]
MKILIFFFFLKFNVVFPENIFFQSKCNSKCIFDLDRLDSENSKNFPSNCSTICAYLIIDGNSNLSEKELKIIFQNVKILYGSLKVYETNLKDLKFFAGMQKIECEFSTPIAIERNKEIIEIGMTNLTDTNCGIRIYDCEKLETLNIPNLKNFYITHPLSILPNVTVTLVSQSFCVTVQEMSNFISSDYYEIGRFIENFCPISDNLYLENQKVCEIQNFSVSNFDTSCSRIIGDVKVKNGDEPYVYKLRNFSWIYGSISIAHTNLEVIDFFDNLEYVVRSPNNIEITVEFNKNLVSAEFPSLKKAGKIYFLDNENFVIDPNLCFGVMNGLNITKVRGIRFEDDNCEVDTFVVIKKNEEMTEIGMTNFTDTNCGIGIERCEKLENLNMPNLKNFYISDTQSELPNINISVMPLQNFCVTVQEMSNFMSSDYCKVGVLIEKICPITDDVYIENQKVCEIQNFSMSNFDPSCSRIIGNIKVKNGDEEYVYKLRNVSWIFGSIFIAHTNLEVIDFFDNLEYVVFSDGSTGITVQYNKNLISGEFPKLKKSLDIHFSNNENFVFDETLCFGITNGLNVTEIRGIFFNGENCYTIVQKMLEGNTGPKLFDIFSILVFNDFPTTAKFDMTYMCVPAEAPPRHRITLVERDTVHVP